MTFKQAHLACLFRSVKWTIVLTANCCFQCFFTGFIWKRPFLQQTQSTNFLVSRDRCQVLRLFWVISLRHYWCLITPSFRDFSLILSNVERTSWIQLVQKQTHLKFLVRARKLGSGTPLQDAYYRSVNVVVFCKVTAVEGNITFYKENERACDGDSVDNFHTWLQLSSCVLTAFLQSIVHIYWNWSPFPVTFRL